MRKRGWPITMSSLVCCLKHCYWIQGTACLSRYVLHGPDTLNIQNIILIAIIFNNTHSFIHYDPSPPPVRHLTAEWGRRETERGFAKTKPPCKSKGRLRPFRRCRRQKSFRTHTGTCWPSYGSSRHSSKGWIYTRRGLVRTWHTNADGNISVCVYILGVTW